MLLKQEISSVQRAEICPLPTIHIVKASDKGSGPKSYKCSQMGGNDRQEPRICPNESYSRSEAFRTGPAAKNLAKIENVCLGLALGSFQG